MTRKAHSYRIDNTDSGSSTSGEPEFVAVGKLRRPHGIRGEIVLTLWTEFPERLGSGVNVFVGKDYQQVKIRSTRWHREDMLVTFEGYQTPEEVGVFRNKVVFVRAEDLPPLEDDEVYLHQLFGLRVIRDDDKTVLGTIVEIIETGANDVIVVQREDGKEVLLPYIDSVVLFIDTRKREMLVHLLPGLLPEEE